MTPAPETLLAAIQQHLDTGNLRALKESCTDFLPLQPEHQGILQIPSKLVLDTGRPAEAAGAIRQRLAANAHDAHAYADLGKALSQLKHFDSATEQFQRALLFDPSVPRAHLSLGLICSGQADYPSAELSLNKEFSTHPNNAAVFASAIGSLGPNRGNVTNMPMTHPTILENDSKECQPFPTPFIQAQQMRINKNKASARRYRR